MCVIYLTSERQTVWFIYEKFFGKVIIDNFNARLSYYLNHEPYVRKENSFSQTSREIAINAKNRYFVLEKDSKYLSDFYS